MSGGALEQTQESLRSHVRLTEETERTRKRDLMQTYFTQMTHCSQRFPISDSKDIDDFLVGLIGMATLKAYKIDKSCY